MFKQISYKVKVPRKARSSLISKITVISIYVNKTLTWIAWKEMNSLLPVVSDDAIELHVRPEGRVGQLGGGHVLLLGPARLVSQLTLEVDGFALKLDVQLSLDHAGVHVGSGGHHNILQENRGMSD